MSLLPVATTSQQVPTMFVDHQTLNDVEPCIIRFTKAAQLIRNAKKSSNSPILIIIPVPGSCIQTSQSWLCTNAQGYRSTLWEFSNND